MKTSINLTNPIKLSTIWLSLMILLFVSVGSISAQTSWKLDAAYSDDLGSAAFIPSFGAVAFTSGTNLLMYSLEDADPIEVSLAGFDNWPGWAGATSSFMLDNQYLLLMNGLDYIILDTEELVMGNAGHWNGLPDNWGNRLDAAVSYGADRYMFMAGTEYIFYNKKTEAYEGHDDFENWEAWPSNWTDGVDAVTSDKSGTIYFFNGNEYLNWNLESGELGTVKSMGGNSGGSFSGINLPTMRSGSSSRGPAQEIEEVEEEVFEEEEEEEETSGATDGWCLTGTPLGDSDAGLASSVVNLKGGGGGEEIEDSNDALQGSRVAEIRIWGSYIITGIQTVLETPEGEMIELPILGDKEGRTNKIVLKPGECVTGIKGRHIGEAGNYVQSIQIITSDRLSKTYGNQGKKAFKINIPDGTSFFGFSAKSEDGYLTSIGVQYVGFEDQMPEEEEEEEEEVVVEEEDTKAKAKNKNEYRDDYIDWVENELTGMNFGATTGNLNRMPNIEWLGKGVDYLTLDPTSIGTSPTFSNPVTLTSSNKRSGLKSEYVKPYGTQFKPINSGESMDNESWITKYSDFTTTVGGSVGASVGVKGIGGGSMSTSYKEMNNSKVGSSEIYYLRTIKREMYNLKLKMKWREKELIYDAENERMREGDVVKYRQKLDLEFRALVEELPLPSGSIKEPRAYVKGKRLPSNIESVRSQYEQILRDFGTHFVHDVTFGGKFFSKTIITKMDYETTRQSEFEFKASAKGQIKAVEIGGDVGFEYGKKSVSGSKQGKLSSQNFSMGAGGITNKEEWSRELQNNPGPMEVLLTGNYDLLNKIYFPDDKDIEKKMLLLKIITIQYLIDETAFGKDSKGDFFSKPKPYDVTYQLTVDKILCTGVDSDEPGSSNEFYGWVKASFSGPGAKTITAWNEDDDNPSDVAKGGPININESMKIKIKNTKKGTFKVWGKISEYDSTSANDHLGEKSMSIKTSEITEQPQTFKVKGFKNDGDKAEIHFTIQRLPMFPDQKTD